MYNQTASKAEQIAITQFIRDGHLSSQIRKSRKIHLAKATELARVIQEVLQEKAEPEIGESGFHVYVRLKTECTAAELAERALGKGLAVLPQVQKTELQEVKPQEAEPQKVEVQEKGAVTRLQSEKVAVVMLNCANVAVEDYEAAMELLKECL